MKARDSSRCPRSSFSARAEPGNACRQRRTEKQCLDRCQVRSSEARRAEPAATTDASEVMESMVDEGCGRRRARDMGLAPRDISPKGDGPEANADLRAGF